MYRSEISIWGINESFCWYVFDPGRPSRAIFKSEPMGNSADSYNLTWKIDSYAPIEEYKLMFRKLFVCPNYAVRFRLICFSNLRINWKLVQRNGRPEPRLEVNDHPDEPGKF